MRWSGGGDGPGWQAQGWTAPETRSLVRNRVAKGQVALLPAFQVHLLVANSAIVRKGCDEEGRPGMSEHAFWCGDVGMILSFSVLKGRCWSALDSLLI